MTQIEFQGRLNSIIFESKTDLFKIIDVDIQSAIPEYDRDDIRVTGNFGELKVGSSYKFTGELTVHPKFGQQFKALSYSQALPREEGSLIKYLSSDSFPGIGKKTAQTIIDSLGTNAIEILKEAPSKLDSLNLSQKQKDSLLHGLNSMTSFSDIMLQFAKYGIRKNVATSIYQKYHTDGLKKLTEDPYSLVGEIRRFGFKTADDIGKSLGIGERDKRRVRGAVMQILDDFLVKNGDTYVELENLLKATTDLLQLEDYGLIADCINELQQANRLVVEGNKAALANIYQAEEEIAQELKRVVKTRPETEKFSDKDIEKAITKAEKSLKIKYDDTQKSAIKNALNNSISILTGGPGTGKTTIINGILVCLRELADIPAASVYSDDSPFLLAAPTGRAAKRMSEITDISAKTIHRLLGIGRDNVEDDELNQLNGEVLIVDEMSMVDMFLFRSLIRNIDATKHIIFVGDQNQLPSVGAGNVFSDLINSHAFPTTVLKTIHRQGEDSSIINLAHAINQDKGEEVIFNRTKNYSFIECHPQQMAPAIEQIVNYALKKGFAKDDIQVLGAMYHGAGGINHLNDILQNIMNEPKEGSKKIEAHDEVFRINDRILQLQNNPEKDIYNGQIGKVIGIDNEKNDACLIANFDGREITFSKMDLNDLTRAYAITIHKSQGSEFPLVILNLTMQNYMMLRRNLLYTAITRAEQNLVMVGEKRAYEMALRTSGNDRHTDLTNKIRIALRIEADSENSATQTIEINDKIQSQSIAEENEPVEEPESYILTPDLIYSGRIDPMIGMDNIKPVISSKKEED